jgi:hypothetical protein
VNTQAQSADQSEIRVKTIVNQSLVKPQQLEPQEDDHEDL